MKFDERIEEMKLQKRGNGLFYYEDEFGKVAYRTLHTKKDDATVEDVASDYQVPAIALFTKHPTMEGPFEYRGILSNFYKFVGNSVALSKIVESITQAGTFVADRKVLINPIFTQMYAQILLRNPKTVPQVGDIFPQLTIRNSYDGTLQQKMAFGISMQLNSRVLSCNFRDSLGQISQKHHESAKTVSVGIGKFVDVFTGGIDDLVSSNMNNQMTYESVSLTLDAIDKIGAKRKDDIQKLIDGYNATLKTLDKPITSWDIFLAILKYTGLEQNINAKVLLENIAERVLIFPTSMMNVLGVEEEASV